MKNLSILPGQVMSKVPMPVKVIAICALLLLFYIRFNINLMSIVVLWAVWKAGFFKWLRTTFGEREAKTALLIFLSVLLLYLIVMLAFHVPPIQDIIYETDSLSWYRNLISPFKPILMGEPERQPLMSLFFQMPFGLLAPTISDLTIRLYLVFISALNIAMFSLFVSRVAPGAQRFNVLLCAALAVSAPQLLYGTLMIEQFMFIQTTMIVCLLYFSFALQQKRYKELELLAIALFCGTSPISIIMFGIFYISLLCVLDKPRRILPRIIKIGVMFVILYHILAAAQSIIYPGINAYVWNMGASVSNGPISYWTWQPDVGKYFTDVFSMPFGFDTIKISPIFAISWMWAILLIPCIANGIRNRIMYALLGTMAFLFVFFLFYDPQEAPLFSLLHITIFFAILAWLPRYKDIFPGIEMLLVALLIVNASWVVYISDTGRAISKITNDGYYIGLGPWSKRDRVNEATEPFIYDNWQKRQSIF